MDITLNSVFNGTHFVFSEPPGFLFDEAQKQPVKPRSAADAMNVVKEKVKKASPIQKLLDLLKNTRGISENNYLPFQPHFIRSTGYIDGINPSDLTESVMWGVDDENRSFIATRYRCDTEEAPPLTGVVTLFQRESNDEKSYIFAGSNFHVYNCGPHTFVPDYFLTPPKSVADLWKNIPITLPALETLPKEKVTLA